MPRAKAVVVNAAITVRSESSGCASVTGVLPIANGATGAATASANLLLRRYNPGINADASNVVTLTTAAPPGAVPT